MTPSCRLTRWASASGFVLAVLIVPALPVAQTPVRRHERARQPPWPRLRSRRRAVRHRGRARRRRGGGRNSKSRNGSPLLSRPAGRVAVLWATGAISRLWRGVQTRVATGLPSTALPDGTRGTPAHGYRPRARAVDAYVTIGFENDPMVRSEFPLIPELAGFASLVHVAASGEWRFVADIGAYEAANNPDGRLTDTGLPTWTPIRTDWWSSPAAI